MSKPIATATDVREASLRLFTIKSSTESQEEGLQRQFHSSTKSGISPQVMLKIKKASRRSQ